MLPVTLTSLGTNAFRDCASLGAVAFPAALSTIGSCAFCGCTSLAVVHAAPACKLVRLGYAAFGGCTALRTVELPNTLVKIHDEAFSGCTSLARIEFVHMGTLARAKLRAPNNAPLHLRVARVPVGLRLGSAVFGGAGDCPELQSVRIWSYGWGRVRALHPNLTRHRMIARGVAFYWYGITAERHCAPGGRWAERDRLAFLAEFGTGM